MASENQGKISKNWLRLDSSSVPKENKSFVPTKPMLKPIVPLSSRSKPQMRSLLGGLGKEIRETVSSSASAILEVEPDPPVAEMRTTTTSTSVVLIAPTEDSSSMLLKMQSEGDHINASDALGSNRSTARAGDGNLTPFNQKRNLLTQVSSYLQHSKIPYVDSVAEKTSKTMVLNQAGQERKMLMAKPAASRSSPLLTKPAFFKQLGSLEDDESDEESQEKEGDSESSSDSEVEVDCNYLMTKYQDMELPEPIPLYEQGDKLEQIMKEFVNTKQTYDREVEGIREFLSGAMEDLLDITCDLYVLNAEVILMEDPALYHRVKHLVQMGKGFNKEK